MKYTLHTGDSAEILKRYPDNSFDSVVTDPPYGIGFLGKDWDSHTGTVELWREVYRVLKPGGHLLAFSAARTYHHLASNIEDVGFEIRDQIMWIYGSGFPKSQDVGRTIQRQLGVKETKSNENHRVKKNASSLYESGHLKDEIKGDVVCTDLIAKEWEGWGTNLKPAHEPIVMARKPMKNSVAENVQIYGTGAINVDGCRVIAEKQERFPANLIHDGSDEVLENFPHTISGGVKPEYGTKTKNIKYDTLYPSGRDSPNGTFEANEGSASRFFYEAKPDTGRFPANLILDEVAGEMLDEQAPNVGNMFNAKRTKDSNTGTGASLTRDKHTGEDNGIYDGLGGASRFYYCPKVSKKERGLGNNHPTVKPIDLMAYLIRLVTKKGGTVLDPFNGSGSTGLACVKEGMDYVGIDLSQDYIDISTKRIEAYKKQLNPTTYNQLFEENK